MRVLLEEMILSKTRESVLERVVNINFVNCDLTDVSIVKRMPNLEIAALSVNGIQSLEVFAACPKLQQLYLRSNDIVDFSEVEHLKSLTGLKILTLEANPCVETIGPEYRTLLLRMLPMLHKIDRTDVTEEEVTNALRNVREPEEPLNPSDAHQHDEQERRSLSPQMEEQMVEVSPLPCMPFTGGHQDHELQPAGNPSMAHELNRRRSSIGSSVSNGEMRLTCIAPIASVAANYQSSDFGQNFRDLNDWNDDQNQAQPVRRQRLTHQQLQHQMFQQMHRQMQMNNHSYGSSHQQPVPQQSQRRYPGPKRRSAPGPSPQWHSRERELDYWQYGYDNYDNEESPQPLINHPSGGLSRRRGHGPNNILSAALFMLQELDIGSAQKLEMAVGKRLRELTRD